MKKTLIVFAIASLLQSCKKKEETPPAPFIDFEINNPNKTHPDTVNFTGSSNENATSFEWDFGDGGANQNGENVTHVFDYGYYFVTLSGTANGQRSTTRKGINTSPFSKVFINGVTVTKIPSAKINGDPWDTDGSGPDVYCKVFIPTNDINSIFAFNAPTGDINLHYSLAPGLVVNSIDKFIRLELYDSDSPVLEDELIGKITIASGVTSLMTKDVPYSTALIFTNDDIAGAVQFQWLN